MSRPPTRPRQPSTPRLLATGRALLASCALAALALPVTTACGGGGPSTKRGGGKVTLVREEPEDFVLDRAKVEEVVGWGPQVFLQNVPVEPVLHGGEFVGFQILAFFPDYAPLRTELVRAGDIVQHVNGQAVGRPEQFMAAWDGLLKRDTLTLGIVRAGVPQELVWEIR